MVRLLPPRAAVAAMRIRYRPLCVLRNLPPEGLICLGFNATSMIEELLKYTATNYGDRPTTITNIGYLLFQKPQLDSIVHRVRLSLDVEVTAAVNPFVVTLIYQPSSINMSPGRSLAP